MKHRYLLSHKFNHVSMLIFNKICLIMACCFMVVPMLYAADMPPQLPCVFSGEFNGGNPPDGVLSVTASVDGSDYEGEVISGYYKVDIPSEKSGLPIILTAYLNGNPGPSVSTTVGSPGVFVRVDLTVDDDELILYDLTTIILGDGTLSPASGSYAAGTEVTLTASPGNGQKMKQWDGTNDDSSTSVTNTVTMNGDLTVTVEFEEDIPDTPETPDIPDTPDTPEAPETPEADSYDVDGDGGVDRSDFDDFRTAFSEFRINKRTNDGTGFDSKYDMNGDEKLTTLDLVLWINEYNGR